MRIKKGDQIIILSGKDKGKQGKVSKTLPDDNKLVVEGLNLRKKHTKSRQADKKGEMILIPSPLHISRVQMVCKHCSKPARIGYQVDNGNKSRICKKCHQAL